VKRDVDTGAAGLAARGAEHLLGNVDPDDEPSGLRPAPGRDRLRAGAAANIQHAMPRGDICKVEQVFPIRLLAPPGEDQQQEIVETGKANATVRFCAARGFRSGLGGVRVLQRPISHGSLFLGYATAKRPAWMAVRCAAWRFPEPRRI
jgi:hypothetical protein